MTPVQTLKTAAEALAPLRSGQRVLIGSGAAAPQGLIEALAARARNLSDVEVLHLMTLAKAPYAAPSFQGHVRHNALFIGANTREAVGAGFADYTPCFLHEVPGLFRSGHLPLDVALVQVTPERDGRCSLGVSVDVVKAAIESAAYVVAQVNANMPWTEGDSTVAVSDIDAFVESDTPIFEFPVREATAEALWIGRYVRELIEDGSTIQVGIGAIPDAVLAALAGKKDLGVHSEMISDGVLDLVNAGVITGRMKSLHPGCVVTSFCMGGKRLYDAVNGNPQFLFHPSDYVNDPVIIASNQKMVSINSALLVDLTGQVAADSLAGRLYSGVGGQVDFVRGATASRGG
ncbi:MAG: 4-hydroxybutyrate CoA-transferase, partial [Elusimicrobia bacterium CG11_big_fil_rev_8_21_14_0_20_64_6]